jgi:PAS domain S-box-containing protein/putative nucleotidyltransferase with HDIG domain
MSDRSNKFTSLLKQWKQAGAALPESESDVKAFMERSAFAIFIYQGEKFLYANPWCESLTGYTREELLKMNFWEVAHPRFRELIWHHGLLRQIDEPIEPHYEFEIIRKDGEARWIDFSAGTIQYGGKRAGIGTAFDITDRKRAEQVQAAIYRISEAALATRDLDELYGSIHAIVGELMPAKNFYVALYDCDNDAISFPYFVDELDHSTATRKESKGLTEYVLRSGESLLVTPEVFRELVNKGEVESIGAPSIDWLGVPLRTGDRIIGIIAVQSYTETVRFCEEDERMLEFVSSQVAMAIERKRAQEDLRESEAFLSNILENIPDMIFVKDAKNLKFVRFNRAGEKLLGYSRQDLIGKDDYDFFPQKEADFFTGNDRAVLANKQIVEIPEEGIHTLHHGRRILHTKKVPVLDSNGNPVYLLGISEDITERRRAEAELRERDQRFRSIAASAPDALLVVRQSDDLILYANAQTGRLVGIPVPDLINKHAPDFLAQPEDRQTVLAMLQRGPIKDCEVLLKRADGSSFWALLTGQLGTFEGEAAIYLGLRDITDRKRVEEAIRTSEAQLSNALRIAHAGHWEYDVDSDTFTFNDNFYQIFRMNVEEVGGYKMSSAEYARRFCHPDDMHLVRKETEAAIKTPDPDYHRELEHRILYSNGEVGYIAVRFFVVKDSEGRTVKTCGVNQDITERKRTEESLRQNEARLRQSMREAISSLSSAIEMRDPYTAGHQAQVTKLAVAIGREIGLAEESIEALQIASMVHDIGKLGIPAEILSKPTKLTQIENELVKTHVEIGFKILDKIEFPWPIAKIVHQHHERIDGSGYPMGVPNGDILLEARIMAVADVVEAMTSHRPYRPALGLEKALEEIATNAGRLYDKDVVNACIRLFCQKEFRL